MLTLMLPSVTPNKAKYEYEYTDGKLTSFNGETISYDSSGKTVYYRGKAVSYFDKDANAIKSIGNAVFSYNADGLRRSKTVNGVTHYYYYEVINLVKEEWGDNILVFFYDANGSPVGMQYRNSTYASGAWDTYLYEKNLHGDIVAVYNTSGTKLVSYAYDAWGRILGTTYHNSGARTSAVHNPFRYRGYYYDSDLDLYYLATRYYDPEVRRFVTMDDYSVLTATPMGLTDKNLFAYCDNNPITRVDNGREFWIELGVIAIGGLIGAAINIATCFFKHQKIEFSNCDGYYLEDGLSISSRCTTIRISSSMKNYYEVTELLYSKIPDLKKQNYKDVRIRKFKDSVYDFQTYVFLLVLDVFPLGLFAFFAIIAPNVRGVMVLLSSFMLLMPILLCVSAKRAHKSLFWDKIARFMLKGEALKPFIPTIDTLAKQMERYNVVELVFCGKPYKIMKKNQIYNIFEVSDGFENNIFSGNLDKILHYNFVDEKSLSNSFCSCKILHIY